MPPPATFRRRFLRAWFGKKSVWLPAAAALGCGVVAIASAAGFPGLGGAAPGLAALAAAATGLATASAAAWFAFGRAAIARRVQADLLHGADGGQRELLRELGRRLIGHGDAAGAVLADDLRKLRRRLDAGVAGEGFALDAGLAGTAERLMDASVNALARSLSIHQAGEALHTDEVKAELSHSRAALTEEVARGVHALGLMLDKVQTAGLRKPVAGELPAVRGELDAGLAVAERVEARMAELERSLQPASSSLAAERG